jgi:acyl transferase domain-containing protein
VLPTLRRASDERLSLLTTRAALFVAGASEPATTAVATSSSTTTTSIGTTSVGTTSVGTTSIGTTSVGTTSVGTTSVVAGSVTSTEVVPTARPRSEPAQLLLLSARSEAALAASRDAMADWIEQRDLPVADLCFTAALRRSHLEHRLAVVGASRPALAAALRHAGTGTRIGARPRIVFVFPGQGSQWPGMGRTLLATEPVFRARFEACAAALAPYLHPDPSGPNFAGPSLAELVTDADASLERSDIVQPLLWAFGVALAALWRELGVTPDAVVGHSMGEVAAACVAGALSLDDGARIIALRSRLARSLVAERGAMAVVELSLADAGRAIADLSPRVVVGVHNGPRSCVLSGEPAALDLVLARLEARGVFCRRVRVDYASHSPQMHALTGPLLAALAGIAPRSGEVPMLSTLSADWQPGAGLDPAYWAANIRERVRFAEAVDRLQRSAPDEPTRSWQGQPRVLLEVSPHPVLLAAMRDGLPTTGGHLALGSLRRDEDPRACLLEALGALHTLGAEARLSSLFPDGGRPIDLPAIAWQRSPHWLPKPAAAPAPIGGHPLLGAGFSSPAQPGTHFFAGTLSSQRPPYLTDHRVGDAIVVPGATWLDLVLAAARQAELPTDTITDARFEAALVLPESGDVAVQVVLTRGDDGPRFECFARAAESWTRHVSGRLQHAPSQPGSAPTATPHPGAALTTATPHPTAALTTAAPRPGAAFYAELAARGLHYGPRCRGVESLAVVDHRVFATLVRPEGSNAPGSVLHPVLLDAALHALVALVPAADARPLVPVGLRRSHLHRAPGASACALARIVAQDGERIEGEVQILDPDGELLVEIDGLQLQRLAGARARHDDRLTLAWRELPAITPTRGPARWLLLPDRGGVATRLQTLLESTGDHVERATDLDALTGTWDGLLDLSGLDLTLAPEAAGEATSRATIDVLDPMLRRAQALSRQPGPELPRLWLLTRGARRVLADDPVIPTQAPIWGLGLTLGYEHPELRCTRVDLPTDDPALTASLHALVTELHADPGEDQLALRGPRRLGARILTGTNTTASHVHPNKTASPTPTSHSDHPNTGTHTRPTSTAHPSPGAHLITGGLGGLGLALAQWWVARGARHLVLLGRRGVTEPTQAATLAELRAAGARIDIHSVDVADADALARVLADLDVPLLGVFHAAGVLDDGLVRNQDRRGLERVMAPKIAGAWNLHRLTRDQPLRHFVLYSSVAALIGSPGQSNYAAANAFLDALAEHRHALGLPALSVAWGAIADVGLAAQDEQRGARLAGRGILPLSVARAHEQLALLLDSPAHIHVGIAAFDPRAWLEFYPTAAASPLFTELRAPSPTTSQSLRAELTAASPDERARLVDDFLRAQVLRVLRVDATRLHRHVSLLELGLDSLTGLELRNRLEAGLGLPLRASLAWTYPRLDELAAHLTELVTPAPPPSLIAPTPTPPEADPDALEQLSDDELMRALAAELERTP